MARAKKLNYEMYSIIRKTRLSKRMVLLRYIPYTDMVLLQYIPYKGLVLLGYIPRCALSDITSRSLQPTRPFSSMPRIS